MRNEFERMWKETFMALFMVLFRNLPGELRKATKDARIADIREEI
jgi:hypothetical protein